ncbi:Zinc finger FYVE domain-containing protein 26 [Frankliniella fusca]|uniref:Zinc finger FYVE domain-containing protein 26 n=1 Tax=Frankliniella fusca TaxID=407009 RepID=A0AAE1LBU4_9NEOP|nr:Zinc finger FYVE domain-containing protein 26 [Frankliniella fusca]
MSFGKSWGSFLSLYHFTPGTEGYLLPLFKSAVCQTVLEKQWLFYLNCKSLILTISILIDLRRTQLGQTKKFFI